MKKIICFLFLMGLLLIGNDKAFALAAESSAEKNVLRSAMAEQTDKECLEDSYKKITDYYKTNKNLSDSWSVWAAYAALGDEIQESSKGYRFPEVKDVSKVTGKELLTVIMSGENPYNYKGKDLVESRLNQGLSGSWSEPIFNLLAVEAAGSDCDESKKKEAIEQCINMTKNLGSGPDLAGWSAVVVSKHFDDSYATEAKENITIFLQNMKKDMAMNTMGSKGLSMGCVVTGLTALNMAGYPESDILSQPEFIAQKPIQLLSSNLTNGEEGVSSYFSTQYQMELADLYQSVVNKKTVGWISCGVTKEKLEKKMEQAKELLAKESQYTPECIAELSDAYKEAQEISDAQKQALIPTYGRKYYRLYDAVRFCKKNDAKESETQQVEEMIKKLPKSSALKLSDEAKVKKARSSYDKLSTTQKAQVSGECLSLLKKAEEKLEQLKLLGLQLTGNYADIYTLKVKKLSNTTTAVKQVKKKFKKEKVVCGYQLKVFDEDMHRYVTKIEGKNYVTIPVNNNKKYYLYYVSSKGKITKKTIQIKNKKIKFKITQTGNYVITKR